MDYEKAFKEAYERASLRFGTNVANELFLEYKESNEERTRKGLIEFFSDWSKTKSYCWGIRVTDIMDWLEKQGEYDIDCPKNHQDSSRPNGCIVLEDFNGGEGFYKLNLDYLNKRQVEEVEEMVRTWNKESKTSNENIKNCIGMCLTDVNEQRFKDYNTNLRDCLAWLEKQGQKKCIDDLTQQEAMDAAVAKCFEQGGQKSAWSEEDGVRLQACIDTLQAKSIMGKVDTINTNWLKSLKQRYTWKPSDEQIEALERMVNFAHFEEVENRNIVRELLGQLKKLKG